MTANNVVACDVYVLVTAHPDDESMFFLPTIRCLQDKGCDVRLLCLTTGDYDGLGKTRSRELQKTCHEILGIQNFRLIDDPLLKDHPTQSWPIDHAVRIIENYLHQVCSANYQRIHMITFDSYGVSGHINHRDTFRAAQALMHNTEVPLEMWSLKSVHNPVIKYIPIYSWCLVVLHWFGFLSAVQAIDDGTQCRVYRLHTPGFNWIAMASHASQWVWYRKLFVLFSCYTFVNHLEKVSKKDV
jgi:N-acetylglucosaminylphosphatidylinositol deacetylase